MYSPYDRLFIQTKTRCKECNNITKIVKVDANNGYRLIVSILLGVSAIQLLGLITLYISK